MIEELVLMQLTKTSKMIAWFLGTAAYIAFVVRYIKANITDTWSMREDGILIVLAFGAWILGGVFSFLGIYVFETLYTLTLGDYTFQLMEPFTQKCIEIAGKTLTQVVLAWLAMKIYRYGIYPNLKD